MQYKTILYIILPAIFLIACRENSKEKTAVFSNLTKDTTIKYAKRFAVYNGNKYKVIYLFGNKENFDTTGTYILSEDTSGFGKLPDHAQLVKIPCTKVAALSSNYAAVLCEFGDLNQLVAVDNM